MSAPVYRERPAGRPGAVVWTRVGRDPRPWTILPDGCLDLIWVDGHLLVAGPDTAARPHRDATAHRHVGLRLGAGLGPWLLGVPADELRDATRPLADLWGTRRTAALAARLESGADVGAGLAAWAVARGPAPDPFGARVADGLARGLSVADVANRMSCSARTLHRRSRPVFGYGPQHLARVLRLQRALDAARRGRAWADVAVAAGYADQPHLAREVRALTGTTPTALVASREGHVQQDASPAAAAQRAPGFDRAGQPGSGANRSTADPSGSCTTA